MAAQIRCGVPAALVAAMLCAAPAAADPPADAPAVPTAEEPPSPPGLAETLTSLGSVMEQRGSAPAGPLGLPDLSASGLGLLLAQNAEPAAPGGDEPPIVPSLNAFNNDYLLRQNLTPAEPGQGTDAPGIGPDEDSPNTGRIAFLRRLHEMYQAGGLKGAFLGQTPPDQLDEPLPAPVVIPQTEIPQTEIPQAGIPQTGIPQTEG